VAKTESAGDRVVTTNRRAFHDYFIDETVEAGVVLTGTEIKSVRAGKVSLTDGFARVREGEAWLENVYVAPYEQGARENPDPRRRRKLLLHRSEIDRLAGKVREKGYTLVPLSLYEKGGRVKVELALVTGKQEFDRREDTKKREAQREIDRAMSARRR
jgi:SsrA-binding protein